MSQHLDPHFIYTCLSFILHTVFHCIRVTRDAISKLIHSIISPIHYLAGRQITHTDAQQMTCRLKFTLNGVL